MTSAFARFQRQQKQPPVQQQQRTSALSDARVGEILSDSSSTLSSADEQRARPTHSRSRSSGDDSDAAVTANSRRSTRKTSGGDGGAQPAKIRQLPARRGMKKTGSRKWYSDSEDEADSAPGAPAPAPKTTAHSEIKRQGNKAKRGETRRHRGSKRAEASGHHHTAADEKEDDDDDDDEEEVHSVKSDASDLTEQPARTHQPRQALKSLKTLQPAAQPSGTVGNQVGSPTSESDSLATAKKKPTTGFQKLVAKTFSPFSSRRKSIESPLALSSNLSSPRTGDQRAKPTTVLSPSSEVTASRATDSHQPTAIPTAQPRLPVSNLGPSHAETPPPAGGPLINRRTSRLKQSPGTPDFPSVPRAVDSPRDTATTRQALEAVVAASGGSNDAFSGNEALSPGQRKVPGAFVGAPGSGVLLEGWLRQKQRRGVKGLKRWNARYFVLYAKSNEVRYYADVVPSAWGPIPLSEIGSISLRLIQKISKPGHPKYRGCRFDITCRNSWGTHYADDYVSSDDENTATNANDTHANDTVAAKSTPRSSRMYSLIADSPQTTVTWMSALDSLLVRSANSPRPDVSGSATATATATAPGSGSKLKRVVSAKAVGSRRRSSTLESETLVLVSAADNVPKPVAFAIKYIFDSTPGIETPRFYEHEPDAAKLKVCRVSKRLGCESPRV